MAHSNSLEDEIKTLKEATENAVKDKEEAQCRFDKDRAELCATLENYKVKWISRENEFELIRLSPT